MMNEILKKQKYSYKVFGLNIISEICISEFLCGEGTKDITILFGNVPNSINNIVEEKESYKISKNEFLFSVNGVADYYVKEGSLIIVEPHAAGDFDTLKVYLISTAIGAALLQRGMIPIHGSSIVIDNKCVIFTGGCGAGKSTICNSLRKEGYKYLSDDISVITLNEQNKPIVQSAFPQQRLTGATVRQMGYENKELPIACRADDKYLLYDLNCFSNEPKELAAIFEIIPEEETSVSIGRVVGMDKLDCFIKNIYCILILLRLGVNPQFFKKCVHISNKIEFFRLKRPLEGYTQEEQIRLVKNSLI